jgi:hypothetical protein
MLSPDGIRSRRKGKSAMRTATRRITGALIGIMALGALTIGPAAGVSMAATHSGATPGITVSPPASPPVAQPDPWDI